MNHRLPVLLIIQILIVISFPALSSAQTTTISLNPSARAQARTDITLSQLADLDGPDADRLGAAVIIPADQARPPSANGRLDIDLQQVRDALNKTRDINWGRLALRGNACSLKLTDPTPETPRPAAPGPRASTSPTAESVDLDAPPTVKTHIANRLARLFNVDPADLRLKFRPEDELLLTTPTSARRVDIQPAASASSPRLPVQVFVYAGDRVVASGTLTVEALVRREVLSASAPIERGQSISSDVVSSATQWVEPNTKPPAAAARVFGSVAKGRINAGAVITDADLEAPVAAKRGELVWVHCLSGSITVKAKARTLSDARDGELVQLRMDGSKKTFTARMSGPGIAVMDLGS